MGLFSFFKKNKQESTISQSHKDFYSTADDENVVKRPRRRGSAAEPDAELPEKKRARRRLIGAVALALAAAIGLPMLFDSEPKTQPDDINLQIPSRDKAALDPKEEIVPSARVETQASAASTKPSSSGDIKPVLVPEVVAPAIKPTPESTSATMAGEQPLHKTEPKTEPKVESKEHKTENKPAKTDVAKPKSVQDKPIDHKADTEAARALAILEGRSDSHAQPSRPLVGRYVIQVAALASQDKVDELRAKLSGAGIPSYTQKVSTTTGDKIRVRVGPLRSQDEADKMRVKLQAMGLNATLVPDMTHQ